MPSSPMAAVSDTLRTYLPSTTTEPCDVTNRDRRTLASISQAAWRELPAEQGYLWDNPAYLLHDSADPATAKPRGDPASLDR
jgi:hypothetical protein